MSERIYKTITAPQLLEIIEEVNEHHSWPMQGRKIKYIDWHYDNRSRSVFTMRFRGLAQEVTHTSTNRCKGGEMEDVDLLAEVMEWLKSGRSE